MEACVRWAAAAVLVGLVCAPTGLVEAEPLRCKTGVAKVRIHGRVAWCADSRRVLIVSDVVESKRAGALAFAIRTAGEGRELVVVLLGGESDLLTMRWSVPAPRGKRLEPSVMWLGKQRVGFGYSPLRPELIATWTLSER